MEYVVVHVFIFSRPIFCVTRVLAYGGSSTAVRISMKVTFAM